ncbi:hypothetical protein AR457_38660 [Streptomyces agglomeratus]|nr:hypothetical protein AR457_38660 [Streptomyces agglomeratus]
MSRWAVTGMVLLPVVMVALGVWSRLVLQAGWCVLPKLLATMSRLPSGPRWAHTGVLRVRPVR